MSDLWGLARVKRERVYRIGDIGREALSRFAGTDTAFTISDVGPNDRVTLTATVNVAGGEPGENRAGTINVELPAWMMEEVS